MPDRSGTFMFSSRPHEELITFFFIFGQNSTFLQFERMMDIVLQ